MEIKEKVCNIAKKAKEASSVLRKVSTNIKNVALNEMASSLVNETELIINENKKDLVAARNKNLSPALIDRLTLDTKRIKSMAEGIKTIADLPDPVGEVLKMHKRPNGLSIGKIRCPIGVIGIIYESRPNVTADAAALCLKSGNAVILRGGSESIHSNTAIANILANTISSHDIPSSAISFIDITDRAAVAELLKLDKLVDLIIPRGGYNLIKTVTENSTIPVLKHDAGICHTYIDSFAELEMGESISINAKVQRPGVCNAMETLLVHRDIAETFLPSMVQHLKKEGVEIRGCARTKNITPEIKDACEEDWSTEYLDLILSIKIVDTIDDAIMHIARYGSSHSDAIVTENYTNAMKFLNEVDSSTVYVNASTRFTDGYLFGMGAEMGISTQKLHARGPVGLEELTSSKFIIFGNGQVRE